MSLTGSLYLGAAAINANRLALQIVGNNITNAATPNYVRDDVNFSPVGSMTAVGFPVGNGVQVSGTSQKIDRYLAERARAASGQSSGAEARSTVLRRAENVFDTLGQNDLSSLYNQFTSAIQDVQNRPEETALRSIAVSKGTQFADNLRSLRQRIDDLRKDINSEIEVGAKEINQGLDKIRSLNYQIVAAENGADGSKAGSLRTLRDQEIGKLTQKLDLRVVEQPSGSVNIFSGSDYLLFDGVVQKVGVKENFDRGLPTKTLVLADSQYPISSTGGRIGGLQQARDVDLGEVIDRLDGLARGIIDAFNQTHASGQGYVGFAEVTGTNKVLNTGLPLTAPQTGLEFPPHNGSFELRVTSAATGQVQTSVINVDLDGIGPQETLSSLVGKLNAANSSINASVTADGLLRITTAPGTQFYFANDTSGTLAGLGVNTFFTGSDSLTIGVNNALKSSPMYFAAARNGQAGDVTNATELSRLRDQRLESLGSMTIQDTVNELVEGLGSRGQAAQVDADTLKTTSDALQSENLSISGVDIDEEAIKLLAFQRGFQASARFITTINELLDTVINLGR